ncbi:MAG: SDR family NAD(P)-dependent oxidoreductase [Bacteroidetes bacterium]|jgi:NADP-dependent 3-hydroxy acid dehydrogenase YdfG|nr:SDR family NAD(P)-dependent oxidoreductase [Bacteroidota bacterium]MBP9881688.1 SDR family NAD(P)-dependent oxidoreductase [Chitinophagales bacterium]
MPIVFITGASSGFGKATAEKFAQAGYQLILNARRLDRLEALKTHLVSSYGSQVLLLPFDVRNREEVAQQLDNMPAAWQKIDVLVNNAGLAAGRDAFQDGSMDDWELMIDTNLKGLMYVSKWVVKGMMEQKSGHIINISSLAGQEVYPQGNLYCATKHAVTALSKGMRMDLLPYHIKVTNISPGLAETEFSIVRFKGDTEKASKVYEGYQPLQPEDIADVIFFAASRPAHVNLEEITILPTAQSDSRTVNKNP